MSVSATTSLEAHTGGGRRETRGVEGRVVLHGHLSTLNVLPAAAGLLRYRNAETENINFNPRKYHPGRRMILVIFRIIICLFKTRITF